MKQYTYHFHAISRAYGTQALAAAASGLHPNAQHHTDGVLNTSHPITTPDDYATVKGDIADAFGLDRASMVLTSLSILNIYIK